jgi:hypothetical protein
MRKSSQLPIELLGRRRNRRSRKGMPDRFFRDSFHLARRNTSMVAPTPFDDLPIRLAAECALVDLTAGVRDYVTTVTLPGDPKLQRLRHGQDGGGDPRKDGHNRLRISLATAGFDPEHFAWQPAHDPHRLPYRGLRPLESQDAGISLAARGPSWRHWTDYGVYARRLHRHCCLSPAREAPVSRVSTACRRRSPLLTLPAIGRACP